MQVKHLCLLGTLLLALTTAAVHAQKDDGLEDYGPEPGPASDPNVPKSDSKAKDGAAGAAPELGPDGEPLKAGAGELELEEDKSKTKFSDERFAKLFPSRTGSRPLMPKATARPKPTLPSFIKSTPPIQRAVIATTPAPRAGQLNRVRAGLNGQQQQQSTASGRGRTTSTTPRPGRLSGRNVPTTARQLSGRLPTTPRPSSGATTPSGSQSAAALAASRRQRQGSGISRFSRTNGNSNGGQAAAAAAANNSLQAPNNSTIPALNPRRN